MGRNDNEPSSAALRCFFRLVDGLIEAFSPTGEMFGEKRLQELIATFGRGSLEGLHDAILSEVRACAGDRALAADLTLLVIGRDADTAEHASK